MFSLSLGLLALLLLAVFCRLVYDVVKRGRTIDGLRAAVAASDAEKADLLRSRTHLDHLLDESIHQRAEMRIELDRLTDVGRIIRGQLDMITNVGILNFKVAPGTRYELVSDGATARYDRTIAQRDAAIADRDRAREERNKSEAEIERIRRVISGAGIDNVEGLVSHRDRCQSLFYRAEKERDEVRTDLDRAKNRIAYLEQQYQAVLSSRDEARRNHENAEGRYLEATNELRGEKELRQLAELKCGALELAIQAARLGIIEALQHDKNRSQPVDKEMPFDKAVSEIVSRFISNLLGERSIFNEANAAHEANREIGRLLGAGPDETSLDAAKRWVEYDAGLEEQIETVLTELNETNISADSIADLLADADARLSRIVNVQAFSVKDVKFELLQEGAIADYGAMRDDVKRFRRAAEESSDKLKTVTEERDLLVTAKTELEAVIRRSSATLDVASKIVNLGDFNRGQSIAGKRLRLVEFKAKTIGRTVTPAGARRRGAGVKPTAITAAQAHTLKKHGAKGVR